jgi:diguanylate cyclase (GGDEF)-like protein/PAS domain S-box-containing protein
LPVRKLNALESLARLAVVATTDRDEALSEAARIVAAVTGSDDVRLFAGDGVSFDGYPRRDGEDFFGLSPDGLMSASQELRRLGRAAVYTVGRDRQPHNVAPTNGRQAGNYVAFSLWTGQAYGGEVVAHGPWTATAARRAGRFLETAGPALAIILDLVVDAERTERLQQQMNVLADVARVFTRAESMREVLGEVVSAINSATGFLCSLDLLDTRGRIAMRSTAASRFTGTPLYESYLRLVRAPDPVRRMIVRTQQPVVLPDLQNDPRISEEAREFYRRASIFSAATFPLLFQDEVVGLLRVGSLKPTSFEPATVDLLRNLALQAAVVVKGVQLWEELKHSRTKTERYAAKIQLRNQELLDEISERRRAEEALRESEEKFRRIFDNVYDIYYRTDAQGIITEISPSVRRFGYTPEELTGTQVLDIYQNPEERSALLKVLFESGVVIDYEVHLKSGDGVVRTSSVSTHLLRGPHGEFAGVEGSLRDITDRKQAENQVKYLAYHDALTGLPNRTLLSDRLAMALAQRRRDRQSLAVIFLDLDRFKLINDTVGHAAGDEALQRIAERLTSAVREGDTVARLGGDEFTVLLPVISGLVDASEVAERILERLTRPLALAGHEFHLSASLGIALYPADGDDAESLLRNADTAMYWAKDQGQNRFQLFTAAMNAQIQDRVSLESDLRHALERGEITVYYQPQVNIVSGQIMGMEALARWRHPVRGILLPADFIPLAEETGLILPIGEWILRTSCTQCKAYQEAGLPPVRVAVNLSSRQFQDPRLVAMVTDALKETGLDPDYLDLEITEGTAMRDVEFTVDTLRQLRGMGVHVSIDDFGTGYSSLAYMSRFPVDSVKIDGSFVGDAPANPDDAAIVTAIIALARTLNLRAVAEGVETKEQLAILEERRCHEAQGHLFGKPVPAHIMAKILASTRPLGAAPARRGRSTKAA